MTRIIFLYLICISPLFAAETGYRVVHPDGTVEFTDQPVEGAEQITLPELPTYSSPDRGATLPPTETKPEKKAVEYSIAITSPGAEETVFFDENGFTVSVQFSPALKEGQNVIVRLDGGEVARGTGTSYTLKDVYRGSHMLSAAILDSDGNTLGESSPITFYMRQHAIR